MSPSVLVKLFLRCVFRKQRPLPTLAARPTSFAEVTMNTPRHPSTMVALSRGGLLSMKPAQHTVMRVLSGCVWVTQTTVERDHFIRAGQCLALTPGLLAVLTAEADSRFVLEAPQKFSNRLLSRWKLTLRSQPPQPAKVTG